MLASKNLHMAHRGLMQRGTPRLPGLAHHARKLVDEALLGRGDVWVMLDVFRTYVPLNCLTERYWLNMRS
jgi:hypothetical protein